VGPELIVALDLAPAAALDLVDRIGETVRWYKIGPVLHVARGGGAALIGALKERGKEVFLDLKWHDIPNTVAGAVAAAADAGVALATVHLAGGPRMLAAACGARAGGLRIVGVGVLTSLDAAEFGRVVGRETPDLAEEQRRLVRLGVAAGLDGYVTAAPEARSVRAAAGPGAVLVVPGVRRTGQAAGDQVRTATPEAAAAAGADFFVVGRPITGAADPRVEARAYLDGARR
jgi:orotidine-5'-phosphate decarboxylase